MSERNPQRERAVELAGAGYRPREIARLLGISRNTAKGIFFRAGFSKPGGQPLSSDLARGRALPQAKLSSEQADQIRERYSRYSRQESAGAIAQRYGVHKTAIWKVVTGQTWRAPDQVSLGWPRLEYPGLDEEARRNQDRAFLTALLTDLRRQQALSTTPQGRAA